MQNAANYDFSPDETLHEIREAARRVGARRVVIDSVSGFELALAPSFREDFRESFYRLVGALTGTGVTVLLTMEIAPGDDNLRFSPYGTAFLTDAIIVQRYIEVDSRLRRVMAVVKVRGSAHSDALREYTITADGMQIGEMLVDQEGLLGGRPTHKAGAGPRNSSD